MYLQPEEEQEQKYFTSTFLGDKLGRHPHLEGAEHRGMITGHYIIRTS